MCVTDFGAEYNLSTCNYFTILIDFAEELRKLQEAGYGQLIKRELISAAKIVPPGTAKNVFLKPHYSCIDQTFFNLRSDKNCDWMEYKSNYDGPLDDTEKAIIRTFHNDKDYILPKPYTFTGPKIVTALDLLMSASGNEGKAM